MIGRHAYRKDANDVDDDDKPELNDDVFAGGMWNNGVFTWSSRFECKQITVTCIVALIG